MLPKGRIERINYNQFKKEQNIKKINTEYERIHNIKRRIREVRGAIRSGKFAIKREETNRKSWRPRRGLFDSAKNAERRKKIESSLGFTIERVVKLQEQVNQKIQDNKIFNKIKSSIKDVFTRKDVYVPEPIKDVPEPIKDVPEPIKNVKIEKKKVYNWETLSSHKQKEYLDLHKNGAKPNIPLKEWAAYKPICAKINNQIKITDELGVKEKRAPEVVQEAKISPGIKKEVVLPQIIEKKKKKSIKIKF